MKAVPVRLADLSRTALACLLALGLIVPKQAAAAPAKAAFFPFEFIDSGDISPTSSPPPEPEASRLQRIGALLAERLTASGGYVPVELGGAEEAIAKSPALRDCQRCADEIARSAGAEIAVVGHVQKVSNLILNINIRLTDARTGQVLNAASADIRGNTDESWTRGLEWLVKNRLFAKPRP